MTPDPDPDPDRPRYRVLARPWYDHAHSDTYPAGDGCVPDGYELLIYRVDRHAPAPSEVLGVTQTSDRDAGRFSAADARQAVCDYVRLRSEPMASQITPADVELYLLVPESS